MSTLSVPGSRRQHRGDATRRHPAESRSGPSREPSAPPQARVPVNPQHHGGTVIFEVGFTSTMSGSDLELLRRQLDMTTHVEHKLPVDPNSPGHAQLDPGTSLLLEVGPAENQWVLQARTWAHPSARTVHDWRVRVAQVAHQLDPAVTVPDRMPVEHSDGPQRPVGRAANRRLATVRRRLVGLP